MKQVRLLVQRFDPSMDRKTTFDEFSVPFREGMTVLDAILHARDYSDHSIGLRYSCRQASCGSCGMKINGKARLACYTQVEELKSEKVVVQPMDNFPIVRDVVTDLEDFFDRHRKLLPRIIRADKAEMDNPTAEYLMSPEKLDQILQFTYCIKCGLCTSSCPTVGTDALFPGPQALAQAYRYTLDVRDEGGHDRFELLDSQHGVFRCHYAGTCSAVCPKGVDPALGIQLLKRHVMSTKPPRGSGEGAKLWRKGA